MPTWQHSDKNGSTCTTYYRTIKQTLCHKQDFNYYIKNRSKSKFRCLCSLTFYCIPPFDSRTITNILYVPLSAGNQGDQASEGCGDDDEADIKVMTVLLRSNSPDECIYAKILSSKSDGECIYAKIMLSEVVTWTNGGLFGMLNWTLRSAELDYDSCFFFWFIIISPSSSGWRGTRTNSVFLSQQISEQQFQPWLFNKANRVIIIIEFCKFSDVVMP